MKLKQVVKTIGGLAVAVAMARTSPTVAQARHSTNVVEAANAGVAQVSRPVASPLDRETLAPAGKLRVGVYPGSPTHILRDASGETRGVTFEIGQELARRLGVPFEIAESPFISGVLQGVKKGDVDFTICNVTPQRALDMNFSRPVLRIELGYLVRPGSRIQSQEEIDQRGIRVGVGAGGNSEETLTRDLRGGAVVVPVPSLSDALKMLTSGAIDAYATNKGVLFQLADQLPGSRVLDGRWGEETFAVAIPKGREKGAPFLQGFLDAARGEIQGAAERARIRGIVR